jgi:chromate transport protein ChrA
VAQAFFKGLTTSALGLIFYSALTLGQSAITGVQSLVVFLVGFVMIQFLKVNPILALFLASLLGLALHVGPAALT